MRVSSKRALWPVVMAVSAAAVYGSIKPTGVTANDVKDGKAVMVGGHLICDCTAPQDKSCSCIVESGT